MSAHAKLSPSGAERWIACPASIRMTEKLPVELRNGSSAYAEEGTCAHALAEIKASVAFGKITAAEGKRAREIWAHDWRHILTAADFEIEEMDRHTDEYVELIRSRMALFPHSQVMFEQKLDTGVPKSWGTSDAVIVSPIHVEIIDFKYGAGVAVEAEGNPQLRLYALGALDEYGDLLGNTEVVYMTVHQPRMEHVLTAEMTPESLREWRSRILPVAEEALGPDARFGPSEEACRWCPASGRCTAQVQAAFPDDLDIDTDPELLSPADMSELLDRLPALRDWLKAFEEAALSTAYSKGIAIPGYKVVRSGGQRKFSDPDGAIDFLIERGYDGEQVWVQKVRGIGELEKLLGKREFAELMAPFLTKTDGRESLVPESDKREAINPSAEAANQFDDIEE